MKKAQEIQEIMRKYGNVSFSGGAIVIDIQGLNVYSISLTDFEAKIILRDHNMVVLRPGFIEFLYPLEYSGSFYGPAWPVKSSRVEIHDKLIRIYITF